MHNKSKCHFLFSSLHLIGCSNNFDLTCLYTPDLQITKEENYNAFIFQLSFKTEDAI